MFRACFQFIPRDRTQQTITVCVEWDEHTETVADAYNKAIDRFAEILAEREGYEKRFGGIGSYSVEALPIMGIAVE
jgi:hypothetical protein